jgi:hypothetical protein
VNSNNRWAQLSSVRAVARLVAHGQQQQRSQLLVAPVRAGEEQQVSAFDYDEPETAKEGIDLGLVLCKQGR